MSGFILKRLGFAVVTLFAVLTVVFFIVRILPGDPAMVILGDQAGMEAIEALRARLGLDRPLPVQYIDFMAGVLNQRDYTMLQGMMVFYTFIVVFVNLVTDLTYGLIDPRVKYK